MCRYLKTWLLPRLRHFLLLLAVSLLAVGTDTTLLAQGGASLATGGSRPFVTGFTPVFGRNGAVGGVKIDAKGVLNSVTNADNLRQKWVKSNKDVAEDVIVETDMRVVSLARLNEQLDQHLADGKEISEEMFFLAGLRRVEYVFVVPDQNDILLAGPAGAWQRNQLSDAVSTKTGEAVLRLDDLADSLRSCVMGRQLISCSIEPTAEGLQRYAKTKTRRGGSTQSRLAAMERAMGTQQVIVDGVPKDSHFAGVMVSADFFMKRYAMGFEPAPVPNLPSYMSQLSRAPAAGQLSSPRWWMAANYESIRRSPDGNAWQLVGQAVKTLTEDSRLDARGQRQTVAEPNAIAEKWASSMTEEFTSFCTQRPVFGQLRNCFDLCVVSMLLGEYDLIGKSDIDLSVLLNSDQVLGPRYEVVKGIPSKGTLVRGRSGWIVSISGGVDIDVRDVIKTPEESAVLKKRFDAAGYPTDQTRWWW